MQSQNIEFIKLLQNQKTIRVLFIVLNILAWSADNITQKDLINNKQGSNQIAQNIYIFILIVSIIVNVYYIIIIENQIKTSKSQNQNTQQLETRKNALIILITALGILLYTQLQN